MIFVGDVIRFALIIMAVHKVELGKEILKSRRSVRGH